jgi:hypothetical protein
VARGALSAALLGRGGEGGFPALRHVDFRRYILGQGLSLIGFWMQNVAQGWLVYRLSGIRARPRHGRLVAVLPVLLPRAPSRASADRVDKWRLIMCTQTAMMLLAIAPEASPRTRPGHRAPLVAVLASLLGAVGAFDLPTRQAFIVEMVGAEDRRARSP